MKSSSHAGNSQLFPTESGSATTSCLGLDENSGERQGTATSTRLATSVTSDATRIGGAGRFRSICWVRIKLLKVNYLASKARVLVTGGNFAANCPRNPIGVIEIRSAVTRVCANPHGSFAWIMQCSKRKSAILLTCRRLATPSKQRNSRILGKKDEAAHQRVSVIGNSMPRASRLFSARTALDSAVEVVAH